MKKCKCKKPIIIESAEEIDSLGREIFRCKCGKYLFRIGKEK